MNIQQLRQSLKIQWLNYYRDNRDWLTRVGVWVTCEGERRPSSSFILATLSVLEPQLTQLLPLIVDLSSNPDRIVIALGLNFNPDEEWKTLETSAPSTTMNGQVKMLPSGSRRSIAPKDVRSQKPPIVEPSVIAEPSKATTVKPPEPINTVAEAALHSPSNSPISSTTSPFEAPIELVETAANHPHESLVNDCSSKTVPTILSTNETIVRPVLDTAELGAGELPKREQVNAVDEACEGRQKSLLRTRHD